jgi:hypothetical protein
MPGMAATHDDAVGALYRARHDMFVRERKRLSAELEAGGDEAGAAHLAKLGRPPISAWAVNQLWWQARPEFDELLRAAERLREADRAAAVAHREALAKLRARAAALLGEAGHAATEATLRRVTTTLSAVAAAGGFEPDPPGALTSDRDPPGFDAVGFAAPLPETVANRLGRNAAEVKSRETAEQVEAIEAAPRPDARPPKQVLAEAKRSQDSEQTQARAEAAAERRRIEDARDQAERHRLEAALRSAKGEIDARAGDVERLRRELEHAETSLKQAQVALDAIEARRALLERPG